MAELVVGAALGAAAFLLGAAAGGVFFCAVLRSTLALVRAPVTGPRSVPPPTLGHMASGGFSIDKRAVAKMMREMQREFDKHPVRVPVETAPARGLEATLSSARNDLEAQLAGAGTKNYFGPVIHVTGDRAQLAWGNGSVVQGQGEVEQQIAPGFEQIAAAVARILQDLPAADLPADDAQTAEDAASEVLREVVRDEPDRAVVRRGLAAVKGVLSPLAMGMHRGAAEGTQDWARTAVEQLTQSF